MPGQQFPDPAPTEQAQASHDLDAPGWRRVVNYRLYLYSDSGWCMVVAWQAVVAVGVVSVVVVALVREWASPAGVMLGGLVLFVLTGVVAPAEAFVGFSSPATVSIAGLFVVARALRDHGGLERGVARLLGDGTSGARGALLRMVPPVVGLSGVVNNTPLVATAGPLVRDWGERRGVAATRLLIPLSFAAILGGVVTTIGTGPNLIVSGLLEASGYAPFTLLTVTAAGLPVAVAGGVVLVVLGPRLLPDRRTVHEQVAGHQREYTVRLRVLADGEAVGSSVAQAGLRDLESTYLASIVRDGFEIAPVPPETVLEAGDELVFVGRVEDIRDLIGHPGLVEAEASQTRLLEGEGHQLIECVVAATSPLVGTTLKELSFRGRYGGAVVAIHRAGERVHDKLGAVRLRAGDALLVLADGSFVERWQPRPDFAVVVPLDGEAPSGRDRFRVVTLATLGGMVALAASGLVSIVVAILAACSVLIATRAIGFRRALDALDRDVLLIVASAIGLGVGLESSGAAELAASGIGMLAGHTGPLIALVAVVVATMVLTELITNAAAAALMVPVAINTAEQVGADPTGFAVAIAIGASASFLTPIGYQTNTIVYGLGGYRFGDYWRLGLPLVAVVLATVLIVVPRVWG